MPKFPFVVLRRSAIEARRLQDEQTNQRFNKQREEAYWLKSQVAFQKEVITDWRVFAIVGWIATTVELVLLVT